jgi:hypothetical protein
LVSSAHLIHISAQFVRNEILTGYVILVTSIVVVKSAEIDIMALQYELFGNAMTLPIAKIGKRSINEQLHLVKRTQNIEEQIQKRRNSDLFQEVVNLREKLLLCEIEKDELRVEVKQLKKNELTNNEKIAMLSKRLLQATKTASLCFRDFGLLKTRAKQAIKIARKSQQVIETQENIYQNLQLKFDVFEQLHVLVWS